MAGEIVLLDQQHVEPAPRRVARDRRPVDAAADDEQVEAVHRDVLVIAELNPAFVTTAWAMRPRAGLRMNRMRAGAVRPDHEPSTTHS